MRLAKRQAKSALPMLLEPAAFTFDTAVCRFSKATQRYYIRNGAEFAKLLARSPGTASLSSAFAAEIAARCH
jgi:hypothetical protein